jgi:hypothetical protein
VQPHVVQVRVVCSSCSLMHAVTQLGPVLCRCCITAPATLEQQESEELSSNATNEEGTSQRSCRACRFRSGSFMCLKHRFCCQLFLGPQVPLVPPVLALLIAEWLACRAAAVDVVEPEKEPLRSRGLRGALSLKLQVDFSELEFFEQIGKGSFKTVFRGRWGSTKVAIVRMRKGGVVTDARVMQRLSTHPNLVQFYRWVIAAWCHGRRRSGTDNARSCLVWHLHCSVTQPLPSCLPQHTSPLAQESLAGLQQRCYMACSVLLGPKRSYSLLQHWQECISGIGDLELNS